MASKTYVRYDGATLTTDNPAAGAAWASASPAVAAAAVASISSGIRPSAGEISRAMAGDTRTAQYTIQQTDVIEEAFGDILCTTGLIYCCGGTVDGVLQQTAGNVYLGRSLPHLTEVRAAGQENEPVLIAETGSSEKQRCRTLVKGTAGDVLILKYR